MEVHTKFRRSLHEFSFGSRVKIAVVLSSLVVIAAVPGCRNGNSNGTARVDEGLFSIDLGGDTAEDHWTGSFDTAGGDLNLVFFEDETGHFRSPGGFPLGVADGVTRATFYTTTWDVVEDDRVTVSVDGLEYEFDIKNINVANDGLTFIGRFVDDDVAIDFGFTRQPGDVDF